MTIDEVYVDEITTNNLRNNLFVQSSKNKNMNGTLSILDPMNPPISLNSWDYVQGYMISAEASIYPEGNKCSTTLLTKFSDYTPQPSWKDLVTCRRINWYGYTY